jgi:hypothetical protein
VTVINCALIHGFTPFQFDLNAKKPQSSGWITAVLRLLSWDLGYGQVSGHTRPREIISLPETLIT